MARGYRILQAGDAIICQRVLSLESFYRFSTASNLEVLQTASVCLEEEEGTLPFRGCNQEGEQVPYPTPPTKIQTPLALCLRIAGSSSFYSALEVKVSDTQLVSMIKAVIMTSKLQLVLKGTPLLVCLPLCPQPQKLHHQVLIFLVQKEAALPLSFPVQVTLEVGQHVRSIRTTKTIHVTRVLSPQQTSWVTSFPSLSISPAVWISLVTPLLSHQPCHVDAPNYLLLFPPQCGYPKRPTFLPAMPAPTCSSCHAARAALRRPRSGQALCGSCFCATFEAEVLHTVLAGHLLPPGAVVAVGASGGKDSTVLAHVLRELAPRLGITLHLVAVDEGIGGYRDAALEAVSSQAARWELPLTIVAYADLFGGWTMDAVARSTAGSGRSRSCCTFCGVLRRRALEEGARLVGASHIVTGEHRKDVAGVVCRERKWGSVVSPPPLLLSGFWVSLPPLSCSPLYGPFYIVSLLRICRVLSSVSWSRVSIWLASSPLSLSSGSRRPHPSPSLHPSSLPQATMPTIWRRQCS